MKIGDKVKVIHGVRKGETGILARKEWGAVSGFFNQIWGTVSGFFSDLWTVVNNGVSNIYNTFTNWINDLWNNVFGKFFGWIDDGISKLGGGNCTYDSHRLDTRLTRTIERTTVSI